MGQTTNKTKIIKMNQRYKELKYDGKKYTKRYEIDEILIDNGFGWFISCEVENIRLEIVKETLVLNSGIWYSGVFEYGVIRDIDWRFGTFENGVIYNGVYKNCKIEKGLIFDGIFINTEVILADIKGGDFRKNVSISSNCKIDTNVNVDKSVSKPQQIQKNNESQIRRFNDFE